MSDRDGRARMLLTGVIAAAVLAGCTPTGVSTSTSDGGSLGHGSGAGSESGSRSGSGGGSGSGSSGSGGTATGASGSALKLLATIAIKGRGPNTGYSRAQFGPAWADTDHNGCDQRDDVLRRDLTNETLKPGTHGCVVLSGTLVDHYTGKTIHFTKSDATAIQIDHVVPLQNAWVTGAAKWSATKREALATDPLNLLAADGPTNESKGSADAATWLPRASYRCAYVARQVAIKAKYGSWMTSAEHKAIAGILAGCPKQPVPEEQTIPLGAGGSGGSPSSTSQEGSKSSTSGVSAGAYCSPEGAGGVTRAGTRMTCSSKDGARARWRSAG